MVGLICHFYYHLIRSKIVNTGERECHCFVKSGFVCVCILTLFWKLPFLCLVE